MTMQSNHADVCILVPVQYLYVRKVFMSINISNNEDLFQTLLAM